MRKKGQVDGSAVDIFKKFRLKGDFSPGMHEQCVFFSEVNFLY